MAQTVLITGTSSGYGKAMAELFLERGWNVLATMRRPDPGVFASSSERLKLPPLDVTDAGSIDRAISASIAAFGAIDVLVNNAGIGLGSIVEATPDSLVREIFETNTFGIIATCRAIIPHMRRQGHGTIVNVTSSVSLGVMPLVAVYAGSKCAVEGFTESLSHELGASASRRAWSSRATPRPPISPPTAARACRACSRKNTVPSRNPASPTWPTIRRATAPRPKSPKQLSRPRRKRATGSAIPPAPISKLLAELRWSTSEEHYLQKMREMFGPKAAGRAA